MFWTTYDEYEAERKTLGKNRVALLEKYAETYEGMTDVQTDEMMAAIRLSILESIPVIGELDN